jgi:phage anti-repressor protein
MNQLIRPESINFHDLVKNSSTTLSLNLQTKMVTLLNEEFSEEQQKWYIANLFMYMNYHSTTDYPINLETAVKILGFAHKKNAKRTLENNFIEGEDYKVQLLPREQNPNRKDLGGRPEEEIMLNMDTFKNLCMLVKTPEGKAARKYYVKLENINNNIIKMEIKEQKLLQEQQSQQLQLKNNEMKLLQIESQEKQHKIELMTRKTNKFEKGESIYIFHSTIEEDGKLIHLYKPGRTKNANTRDTVHKTSSYKGILLQIKCVDSVILERNVHFLLNKYRKVNRREWFQCSYNTIKNCIEYAKLFLENEIDYENEYLLDDTSDFINTVKINVQEKEEEKEEIKDKIEEQVNTDIFTTLEFKPNDIDNFETFINENCDIEIEINKTVNSSVSHITIKDQYKIWSKTASYSQLKKLMIYLKSKYVTTMKRFNPLVTTSKLTHHFKGIKLKESLYTFEKPNTNNLVIENFLFEKCQRSPGYRVTMQDLFLEFENWYSKDFTYVIKEKIKIYMDTFFIRSRTGDESEGKDTRLGGWLGIALKSSDIPEPIKKYKPKNAKIILQKNVKTNEIIKEWPSIAELAFTIEKSNSVISLLIKRHEQILIDNIQSILEYK